MNNTVLRTISGAGFIVVMLAGLLVNKFLFAALVIFIMSVMMHEFYTITMNDRYKFPDFWRYSPESSCFH